MPKTKVQIFSEVSVLYSKDGNTLRQACGILCNDKPVEELLEMDHDLVVCTSGQVTEPRVIDGPNAIPIKASWVKHWTARVARGLVWDTDHNSLLPTPEEGAPPVDPTREPSEGSEQPGTPSGEPSPAGETSTNGSSPTGESMGEADDPLGGRPSHGSSAGGGTSAAGTGPEA